MNGLTGQGVRVYHFFIAAVDKSGLIVDTRDDSVVVVEVSRERVVLIGLIFVRTREAQQVFGTAANFVGPIAPLYALVIKQTLLTLFALRYSPQTLRIEYITQIRIALIEYTELVGTAMC
jgi:hypothetical protein